MKATRIAFSKNINQDKLDRLTEIAKRLGALRTELWDRYGSVAGVGIEQRELRDQWLADKRQFDVPARLWKETLRDTMADIAMYREAAKVKVRRAIPAHSKDKSEQKRLYTLLKADRWLGDTFLRRMMRKYFKHGHTSVNNQIVLDTGCYTAFEHGGKAWIDVMSLERGQRIAIPLGTNVKPDGTLRVILRDDKVEVHYTIDVESKVDCGDGVIGIDKGYTEVFTDSDGEKHGLGLGDRLSAESDFLKEKYKNRNKLKARPMGTREKKPHGAKSNLGRKKLDKRKKRHDSNVRDIAFKAAHSVVDKAKVIVCEDLTSPIPDKKKYGKNQSRRLSGWVKGTMAEAIETVSQRRGSSLSVVNAAYTSQMDSRYGTLLGQRTGDTFYCIDGVVLDADTNAARNILARRGDPEITLYTPYKQVKAILSRRTAEVQTRLGLLNQDTSCNGYQLALPLSTVSEEPNFYQ